MPFLHIITNAAAPADVDHFLVETNKAVASTLGKPVDVRVVVAFNCLFVVVCC